MDTWLVVLKTMALCMPFAYSALNDWMGGLASYYTNNHCISVQLMRRFLDYKLFGVHNWPQEFQSEYFPLFQAGVELQQRIT